MKLRLWAGPVLCSVLLVSGCARHRPDAGDRLGGQRDPDHRHRGRRPRRRPVRGGRPRGQVRSVDQRARQPRQAAVPRLVDGLRAERPVRRRRGHQGHQDDRGRVLQAARARHHAVAEPARTKLEDVFKKWADGRAILVEAGAKETGQAPSPTNLDQLITAGLKARTAWMKKAEIDADRVRARKAATPGGRSGSVSVASSTFAKNSVKPTPDPAYVSGLPANQKCG